MLWLVITVLLWGFFHSLFATLKVKGYARRWLGGRFYRFYRLSYNIFACISFLPVLVVAVLTPIKRLYLVPFPWSVLMMIGELGAIATLVIGFRQTNIKVFLGLNPIPAGEQTRPGSLVTSGLYRYVRHPLYSAGLVFIWLIPLMTLNILLINISLTVYVITGAFFEERRLFAEFGQDYAEYQVATPMFIPFLKRNKSNRKAS
jgi:protein-S-isoprenylcysteine O-methyltransferase Ste14